MEVFKMVTPLANGQMFHDGSMWGGGVGFFGALMGFVFTLIFWALVVAGIVYLVKYLVSRDKEDELQGQEGKKIDSEKGKPSDKALEVLRERYAKGEIDKREFDQKKKDLLEI
ncbi:MAG: SHOCT domain-containing protein [Candidatus Moranbacteria bacterium]|nr:SHOCT domain-containing protein [Candidatus Moranbacteria bacterium]